MIDAIAWAGIHLSATYLAYRVPARLCRPERWWWRSRHVEHAGNIYETALNIRRWKHLLPDGGALLPGGFSKSRLTSRDPAYLERFAIETCRGELAHWLALACAPAFALFNPPPAVAAMHLYGVASNLPCIAVQRYNRARLVRLSRSREPSATTTLPAEPATPDPAGPPAS